MKRLTNRRAARGQCQRTVWPRSISRRPGKRRVQSLSIHSSVLQDASWHLQLAHKNSPKQAHPTARVCTGSSLIAPGERPTASGCTKSSSGPHTHTKAASCTPAPRASPLHTKAANITTSQDARRQVRPGEPRKARAEGRRASGRRGCGTSPKAEPAQGDKKATTQKGPLGRRPRES